jgi:hypothetical protein
MKDRPGAYEHIEKSHKQCTGKRPMGSFSQHPVRFSCIELDITDILNRQAVTVDQPGDQSPPPGPTGPVFSMQAPAGVPAGAPTEAVRTPLKPIPQPQQTLISRLTFTAENVAFFASRGKEKHSNSIFLRVFNMAPSLGGQTFRHFLASSGPFVLLFNF